MTLPTLHLLSLPTPFPVGPVNVYLAEGDPLTLIDCGPKYDPARLALEEGLAAHGFRVEDLRRLILTHHHVDHVGLAAEIVGRSGAEVSTHPYNAAWLADYAAHRARNTPFYREIWDEGGVPEAIIQAMGQASEGVARWLDPVGEVSEINEGDTVRFAGRAWQVFHTPGHAGGLVCLWQPESRTLLSNDHLLRDISSNPVMEPPPIGPGPRPKRLVEYLREMRRMAALDPVIALPGHGEPIHDVPALVRQRAHFHQRRAQKILQALDGRTMTLWDLTSPIFPHLQSGMDYFLALSEIQGHLDLLAQEGAVEARRTDGVVRWQVSRTVG